MPKQLVSMRFDRELVERLRKMKHPGQSFDGVLQELLDYWESKQEPKPHRDSAS